MANLIGLRVRRPEDPAGDGKFTGPLHAVDARAGQEARETYTEVSALCGESVQVVPVEDVPDDAGLCPACRYGD